MVRLRNAEIFSSLRWLRVSPETITSPAVGVSKPAISWMRVVLPEPLGPMMASKLPSRTCRLRLRSACTRSLFSRNSTLMFSRWIMTRDSGCNGASAKCQNQSALDGSAVTTSLRAHRYLLDTDVSRAGSTRTVYRIRPEVAVELARGCIYIEHARSGKAGAARRPLFEQMKPDAAGRKFSRLLVWKVSRLGRDWKSSGDDQGKPN